MNIATTRIQKPLNAFTAPSASGNTFAEEKNGGLKDTFQSVGKTITEHPMRSIVNFANVSGLAGTMSTLDSYSANAKFCQGLSAALGFSQFIGGMVRGIDALASTGYARTGITGQPPKNQAFSAIGDIMAGAGHLALSGGVTTPAAVLILAGAGLSSAFDYST